MRVVQVGLLLLCCSCSHTFFVDRWNDLTDVFDVKFGYLGVGIGAKIQITDFVSVGAGFGCMSRQYEKYGSVWIREDVPLFLHLLVIGADGSFDMEGVDLTVSSNKFEASVVGINLIDLYNTHKYEKGKRISARNLIRVGGEVWLPGFSLGLYINLGEVVDLLAGLFGFDLMEDDL